MGLVGGGMKCEIVRPISRFDECAQRNIFKRLFTHHAPRKTPLPVDTGKRGAGNIWRASHLSVYHTDGIGT